MIALRMLLFACLLSFFCVPRSLFAQSSGDPNWRALTAQDGLLSNDVWSVLVDGDTIWVGTDHGIARYDGAWTNFSNVLEPEGNTAQYSGLPPGRVTMLVKSDGDNSIWAATDAGAVSSWDGDSWNYEFRINPTLNTLLVDEDSVYLGADHGLLRYDRNTQKITDDVGPEQSAINALWSEGERLWAGADNGLWRRVGDRWFRVHLPTDFESDSVSRLWQDGRGRLWVGTEYGVLWFDPAYEEWSEEVLPIYTERGERASITALTGDLRDNIWAGSRGGGARKFLDDGAITIDVSRSSGGGLTTPQVRDIAVDAQGSIWLGTSVGLFQYQEGAWFNEYREEEGVDRKINAVNDLLVDRWGRIWIATGAGVRLEERSSVGFVDINFNQAGGYLPADGVNALEEDAQGGIWAGTFDGLARFQLGEWATPIAADALTSPVVTDFCADDFGIWIGTEEGLNYYHLVSRQLTEVPELSGQVVEVLAKDSEERLWVGTAQNGIWIRSLDGTWQHMEHDPDQPGTLPSNSIALGGLSRDTMTSQGMWANVKDIGLTYWNGESWNVEPNELPSKVPYRLFSDSDNGGLWVGSEGGVSYFDGTTWGTFSVDDGLQSTAIYAIAYEPDGAYWFGGPEGLSRYQRDTGRPWVQIQSIEGADVVDGSYQTFQDASVLIDVVAGDLQTADDKMKTYYRTDDSDQWRLLQELPLRLPLNKPKTMTIEFMARDQAFNYSKVVSQDLEVLPSPELMTIPFLGEVQGTVFGLLVLLAGMAIVGFGYVSYELITSRLRSYEAINRGFNPYVSGEPIRDEDMFYGRQQLLQRIVDTLHNNSIMIHGERRIGKTTLLYQLGNALREIDDPEYWFLPVYIDMEGTIQEEFFHFLIEEIAVGVRAIPDIDESLNVAIDSLSYHNCEAAAYTDRDFNHDLRTLIEAIQQFGAEHYAGRRLRLILLLDEMDVISKYDHLVQQKLRRIFMRDFAATLGAIVAGIQISKEWDRVESPWFNLFNEIALQPFSRDQAFELLIEPVRPIYRYDPAALEYIVEVSDGRPFRIQQYALESVNHMLGRRSRKITLGDVEAAQRHIEANYGDVALSDETDSSGRSANTENYTDGHLDDIEEIVEGSPDMTG